MTSTKKVTVLLAEDREVVRLGMRHLLGSLDGCEIIGEAEDGRSAIEQAQILRPTIVFIKRDLPKIDGIAASQQIKKQGFGTRVIMLLSKESDFWTSIDSGADGYIMRETPELLISAAVDIVSQGGSFIGPLVAHYLLHGPGLPMIRAVLTDRVDMPGLSLLSRREKQILRLLIDGLSNQQMADTLELEVQTIKVHVRNTLKKLNAHGRTDAVAKVLRTGMTV
ncbi:response regulator transcription factor [bacterium]|nr:response regulator transcription factor [bacterium]MBP9807083.1 response regulator transcription factor [bacterium]